VCVFSQVHWLILIAWLFGSGAWKSMAWFDEFHFINKHTMFLLQLHPVYRTFYALVYGIWGSVLLYYATKHRHNDCAKVHDS
jgi:hypothetical protein